MGYCLQCKIIKALILYQNHGYLDKVINNINLHSMIQLHPSTIISFALPAILENTPESFFVALKSKLKESSTFAFEKLSGIRGIKPIKAKAAMYMMVGLDIGEFADVADDVDFAKKMLGEECVLVFPS
jgi:aspartate/methionine/tyrosine aminotransferase